MMRDAYGFPNDHPPPSGSGVGALIVSVLLWSTIAVCAAIPAVLVGVESGESDIDRLGIGVMTSVCAWPAAATAVWSVVLYAMARQRWTQLGPNVALGCVTGGMVWLVLFCGLVVLSVELG